MNNKISYHFNYITKCNMCCSPIDNHQILGKRLNTSQGKNPRRKLGISVTICKCINCNLIYSNPQPIPFNINYHYGVPPEDYWSDVYFKMDTNYFLSEISQLKTLLSIKEGMKSLDIGAGLGKAMIALSNAGFDSYGFEPSFPFYERAINKMGIKADKIKNESIETAEYSNDYFDFISFGAVLEHLYDPSEAIKKALHWLKPNGLIHIEVPSSDWLVSKIINFYYKLRGNDYVGNLSPMHIPFHLYEFGIESFKEHAKQNNYKIAFHEYYVCQTYMPKVINWVIKPYMKYTNKGMQLCIWLKKN